MNFSQSLQQKNLPFLSQSFRNSLEILQFSSMDLVTYLQKMAENNPLIDLVWHTAKRGNPSLLPFVADKKSTLEDDICSQLRILKAPAEQIEIAFFIAGNMNDRGYLEIDLNEVSLIVDKPYELVESALFLLQTLDPAGIGARNVRECLTIQINRDPSPPPLAHELVCNFLYELAEGDFKGVANRLQTNVREVNSAYSYIQNLNPNPGLAFGTSDKQLVIPDIYIRKQNGKYIIELNDAFIPSIALHPDYEKIYMEQTSLDIIRYIKPQMQMVQSLKSSLSKRQETLLKVMQTIIETQINFLDLGMQEMRPLTLKVVAEKLQFSESTISRAIKDKSVQTPHGVHDLKFFFSSSIPTGGSDPISSNAVKAIIKELISQEKKPLSDQKIMNILQQEMNIRISRRTVAKYRDEMLILPSHCRH